MTKTTLPATDIAIVGMSAMFPKAPDLKGYWNILRTGKDCITDIPESHWKEDLEELYSPDKKAPDRTYCKVGGFLDPVAFDPTEFSLPPNVLEATDTSQLLSLVAAKAALEDAGYEDNTQFDREMTSVIIGVTGTLELVIPLGARLGHPHWRRALQESGIPDEIAEEVMSRLSNDYVPWQENSFPGLLGNVVAGRIASRLDLHGTNCVVDAACASTLAATHLAVLELAHGKADMVITGGVDTFNDIFMYMCFSKTPALSPTGQIQPFGDEGDGTLIGEGIGMLVLKRLEDAKRDNDRIYSVIKGVGSSSDGAARAIYTPFAEGQERALRRAYASASIEPGTVEMVEAHSTGTKVGDLVEFESLTKVFGEHQKEGAWCALGSVKSQIGHTKAAAGVAGLIKSSMALYYKTLLPTINIKQPNPKLGVDGSPFYLNTLARPWVKNPDHPRRAGVSAFGFGGSNYHVVLEEFGDEKAETSWDKSVEIVALSGESTSSILAKAQDLLKKLIEDKQPAGLYLAQAREKFDAKEEHRLTFASPSHKVIDQLKKTIDTLQEGKTEARHFNYHQGSNPGEIAILFPGQGSQYVDMGRAASCVFPQFLSPLEVLDKEVTNKIFPFPAFNKEDKDQQQADLTATDIAQPALGAISLGYYHTLLDFGLEPAMSAGHSYGELCALYAAGVYDQKTLLKLSHLRGSLMNNQGEDLGTMLAVKAPLEQVDELLKKHKLEAKLANRNSPTQGVLSGSREAIAKAQEVLQSEGLTTIPLNVAAAFHSSLVAGARDPFRKAMDKEKFQQPKFKVFANKSAQSYPKKKDKIRDLLADQLVHEVHFVEMIRAMHKEGARTFVEIGPKRVLSRLVDQILGDEQEVTTLAVDASQGKGDNLLDLAKALAQLSSLGYAINLSGWEKAPKERKAQRMTIQLTGSNYRDPRYKDQRPAPREMHVWHTQQQLNQLLSQAKQEGETKVRQELEAQIAQLREEIRQLHQLQQQSLNALAQGGGLQAPAISNQTSDPQLNILQQMAEQTAYVHQRFLDNQLTAHQTFQQLFSGQPAPTAPSVAPVYQPPVAPPVAQTPVATPYQAPVQQTSYHPPVQHQAPVTPPAPTAPVAPTAPAIPSTPVAVTPASTAKPSAPVISETTSAPASSSASSDVSSTVLEVIAEKTGYPTNMLDTEMDLEADLGIDSIKRVEILAAIEEHFPHSDGLATDDVGSIRTIKEIINALGGSAVASASTSTPAPTATVASTSSADSVQNKVLQVVADKTGYPVDMLSLDMDLEADLGIDSIKRVEILASVEESVPEASQMDSEAMSQMRTLQEIVDSLGAVSGSEEPTPSGDGASRADDTVVLSIVSDKTGYPVDMLSLDMDLESDLGIDSIKRVEILSAIEDKIPQTNLDTEQAGQLKTLQEIVDAFSLGKSHSPSTSGSGLSKNQDSVAVDTNKLQRLVLQTTSLDGSREPDIKMEPGATIHLVGEPELCNLLASKLAPQRLGPVTHSWSEEPKKYDNCDGIVFVSRAYQDWHESEAMLKKAFTWLHLHMDTLSQKSDKGTKMVATISQLDGRFGLTKACKDPLQGALAGLPKTVLQENPHIHCKALDVDINWDIEAKAQAISQELLVSSPLEVGINQEGLHGYQTLDTTYQQGGAPHLEKGETVLVTGGARGVTAAVTCALAQSQPLTFILLGRSPLPQQEEAWSQGIQDAGQLKQLILKHQMGGKGSPKELQQHFDRLMASREIHQNIATIQATGSTVAYRSCDVRDLKAVRALVKELEKEYGKVRGFIHGAGVLRDRKIADKTQEQFDSVFDTKIHGVMNFFEALEMKQLKFVVFFSSVTARFGRPGQVDYCMANEALNKIAQNLNFSHPELRIVALNWGPWDGGMVNDGLRKEFARIGVGLIPILEGSQIVVSELTHHSPGQVEVLIGDGFPTPESEGQKKKIGQHPPSLSLKSFPFLKEHSFGHHGVVPAALMLEWMAQHWCQKHPGQTVPLSFKGFKVFEGIRFQREDSIGLRIENEGERLQLLPSQGPKPYAQATFSKEGEQVPTFPLASSPYPHNASFIYDQILFHQGSFRAIQEIAQLDGKGLVAKAHTNQPSQWLGQQAPSHWLTHPLLVDTVLQLGIVWSYHQQGTLSLPSAIEAITMLKPIESQETLTIELGVRQAKKHQLIADIRILDANKQLSLILRGVQWTLNPHLSEVFQQTLQPQTILEEPV